MTDAPYLTPAAAKLRNDRLAEFDDDDIAREVRSFEGIAEDFLGVAFTSRTVTETYDLDRATSALVLDHVELQSVTSVTVDGELLDTDGYRLRKAAGILERTSGRWATGVDIDVVVVHGYTEGPPQLLDACAEYVDSVLRSDESGTPRDVIAQTFDGGITKFSTPDKAKGRPTGWLEVDRLVRSVQSETAAVGFA